MSDEEVKAKYVKEGDTANVSFVRFSPTMYSEKIAQPKPAELDAWIKANEPAIAEYYEKNKFSFFEQEKAHVKQILLKVPPDADDAKKAEIKQRAENTRKDIVDNKKDFSEIAKAVSEDLESKEKGGDLGYVERLALPGAFADLVFALKPGEVTAPVETPMGWFVGTLVDKKAPEQRPLETVKREIAAQLFVKEKARALAKADADKALAEAKAGKKLAELYPATKTEGGSNPFAFAAETKPEAKETGSFNSTAEDLPQLGKEPALKKMIFDMKAPGLIDQVLNVGDTLVVATVDERKQPSDADFDTQKAQLKTEAVKGKQFEVREGFLKSLKQTGNVVTNDSAIDKVINNS